MKLFVIFSSIAMCLGAQVGYNYKQPEDVNVLAAYGPMYGVAQLGVGGGGGFAAQPEADYLAPVAESYHKEFYTFGAPEEDFEDMRAAQRIAASIQKNLRVVFIRAPENRGIEQAALSLAKHSTDDRTAIFVLNKQHDIGDLAQRLSAVREQQQHRPEVHFVKYRTPEEAAHAQRYIQSHYDALRGTTHSADGGVAPVLNFVSRPQVSSVGAAPALNFASRPQVPSVGAATFGSGSLGYGGAAAGGAGGAGGYDAAYYGTVGAVAALQRGASVGDANGVPDGAAFAGYAENTVGKINSQLASTGGNFMFPTAVGPSSTYLPPLKAKH